MKFNFQGLNLIEHVRKELHNRERKHDAFESESFKNVLLEKYDRKSFEITKKWRIPCQISSNLLPNAENSP